jgi:hypothetical protein
MAYDVEHFEQGEAERSFLPPIYFAGGQSGFLMMRHGASGSARNKSYYYYHICRS